MNSFQLNPNQSDGRLATFGWRCFVNQRTMTQYLLVMQTKDDSIIHKHNVVMCYTIVVTDPSDCINNTLRWIHIVCIIRGHRSRVAVTTVMTMIDTVFCTVCVMESCTIIEFSHTGMDRKHAKRRYERGFRGTKGRWEIRRKTTASDLRKRLTIAWTTIQNDVGFRTESTINENLTKSGIRNVYEIPIN